MNTFDFEKVENTEIEIYFKYRFLDTGELAELLEELDTLYKLILDYSYPVFYFEKYDAPFRNFLEIESINTGNSITLKFKEGWKPELNYQNQEIEILIPRKLGVPAILLYFLLQGVQRTVEFRNDILDGQLKEIEFKIKKIELYQKIDEINIPKKQNQYHPKNDRLNEVHSSNLVRKLLKNQNITYVEINNLVVKNSL
jgi:hypothetical protein